MSEMNRKATAGNPYQGNMKRVLCVCSAGLLRSPSIAFVLSNPPFNYNTRAAGVATEYALIPVDDVLVHWADEIVCAEQWHADTIITKHAEAKGNIPIFVLNIPDEFETRDPELCKIIQKAYSMKIEEPS